MDINAAVTQPDSIKTMLINPAEEITTAAQLIKEGRFEELLNKIVTGSIDFAGKILLALVIFFVGRWLIKKMSLAINRLMTRRGMDIALRSFLKSVFDIFFYTFLFIIIVNVVGKQTVSLAALIGSVGLAVGLAVKDNLANFAGGVMLLLNKPFKGGDYIEAQNLSGTVKSVGILYTTLTTADNKTVYIPNGPLSTGNITNYSAQETRRIEITAAVDYGSDIEMVKKILLDIAFNHPKILPDPEPFARLTKINESSLDFVLRVWVKSEDFWPVTFDLNEEIYRQLTLNGLNIPFPQLTVHLAKENQADKQP